MGMPSASVQPGTQPQGKGFAQPVNPQQENLLAGLQAQASQPQMNTMAPSSIYTAPQDQQPQQGQSTGKGSSTTNAATSGQPQMGMPNMYPNTVGQWDNASIQPQQSRNRGGKGKG
jgi:hypothetical protein